MEFHNIQTVFSRIRSTGDLTWSQVMKKTCFIVSVKVKGDKNFKNHNYLETYANPVYCNKEPH